MAAYVAVADGLSFGAFVGWIVGLGAVVVDRMRAGRPARALQLARHRRRGRRDVGALAAARRRRLGVRGIASATATASVPAGFLRADGSIITDGDGNQVLLRGVNVNQLVDFYRPRPEVDDTGR